LRLVIIHLASPKICEVLKSPTYIVELEARDFTKVIYFGVLGLQRLTGGIVIWREGPAVVIYRGKDYVPVGMRKLEEREEAYRERLQSLGLEEGDDRKSREWKSHTTKIAETEIEELLDDLGPEYTEWTEGGSVPVDGDLLVPPLSGFKSPFRRLPYGVRPRLTNIEMTEMRHLARKLPPHFALGGYLHATSCCEPIHMLQLLSVQSFQYSLPRMG
jgi:hypothetical protein